MSKPTLFTNALLIDGTGRDAVRGASVLVEGQTIRQVSTTPLEVPPEIERIDLKGRALLPGLMDAHVHAKEGKIVKDLLRGAKAG